MGDLHLGSFRSPFVKGLPRRHACHNEARTAVVDELHQVEPGSVGTSTQLINKSLELESVVKMVKNEDTKYTKYIGDLNEATNLPKIPSIFLLNIIYAKRSSYVNVC